MTMSIDDAVAATQRFASLFEAVQVIAGQIKDARLVEQLTREASDARDAMLKELETAKGDLAAVKASILDAQRILKQVQQKADATFQAAQDKAKSVMADADARAAVAISKAKADSDNIFTQARNDLNAMKADIEALAKQKADLVSEIQDRSGELVEVRKSIADARALLANFMGAK